MKQQDYLEVKTGPDTPQEGQAEREGRKAHSGLASTVLPLGLFLLVESALLMIGVVLPLRGLNFYDAMPETRLGQVLQTPTRLIFRRAPLVWPVHPAHASPGSLGMGWKDTLLLFIGMALFFGFYLLALRVLPRLISTRFLFITTAILGLSGVFFPGITSQDIFSYIAYARIGVIYHLNPLTTLPSAISTDPIYPFIYWVHQPSAYGPTWALITCALQGVALLVGARNVLSMVLLLRLFGLVVHLGSVLLVWKLSGSLQQLTGTISARKRMLATLAFAWNPLLIIEACVNAHNDTIILFIILVAVWLLFNQPERRLLPYLAFAALLALATCLKVTLIVLLPGFLLFIWVRQGWRLQHVLLALTAYIGTVALLYAPFWDHGTAFHVFVVNPGITRDVNGPYEFITHIYETVIKNRPFPRTDPEGGGTRFEVLTHQIGSAIYILLYAAMCVRMLIARSKGSLLGFIQWMVCAWLLYCVIGSPWFWSWYLTLFFGLFALLEAVDGYSPRLTAILRLPLAARLFAFALLLLYCFDSWAPHQSAVPGFPYLTWTYTRGFWVCLIPLLALCILSPMPFFQKYVLRRRYAVGEVSSSEVS